MVKSKVIAHLVVAGSLCLMVWSGFSLYRKARSLEMIAETRDMASERVNRALREIQINWGDHSEPAPSGHGLSAKQATFLLCIGVFGILVASPRLGGLPDSGPSKADAVGPQARTNS